MKGNPKQDSLPRAEGWCACAGCRLGRREVQGVQLVANGRKVPAARLQRDSSAISSAISSVIPSAISAAATARSRSRFSHATCQGKGLWSGGSSVAHPSRVLVPLARWPLPAVVGARVRCGDALASTKCCGQAHGKAPGTTVGKLCFRGKGVGGCGGVGGVGGVCVCVRGQGVACMGVRECGSAWVWVCVGLSPRLTTRPAFGRGPF